MKTEEKRIKEKSSYMGLNQRYHDIIKNELKRIKKENSYESIGKSFAHWYLNELLLIDDSEMSEIIIDGSNDWGIDAIIIDVEADIVKLYQFKFPTKSNIRKKTPQADIQKLFMGYKICASGDTKDLGNKLLKEKTTEITDLRIFTYELNFIAYNTDLGDHAKAIVEKEIEEIIGTGNKISMKLENMNSIAKKYHRKTRMNDVYEITLKQVSTSAGFFSNDIASTYILHASIDELAVIAERYNDDIFDENVRLYHGSKNKNNTRIIDSAINNANIFHLYNNGVVILSDKVSYNSQLGEIIIKNPKVVNGCQTLNSLLEAKAEKKGSLEGCVELKVIEIEDVEIRQNISVNLNSQSEIKDSYLVSNKPIVIELEKEISELGYFFERQANTITQLKKTKTKEEVVSLLGRGNSKVIRLEIAFQAYSSFFVGLAHAAKANKAKLFNNDENLSKILSNINAAKVIFCSNVYYKISAIVRDYRRFRRNPEKRDILVYLNIKEDDIDNYLFINTSILLILAGVSLIADSRIGKFNENGKIKSSDEEKIWFSEVLANLDEYIVLAIDYLKLTFIRYGDNKAHATLTKSIDFCKKYFDVIETEEVNDTK